MQCCNNTNQQIPLRHGAPCCFVLENKTRDAGQKLNYSQDYGWCGSVEGKVLVLLCKPKAHLYRRTHTHNWIVKDKAKRLVEDDRHLGFSFRRAQ